MNQLTVSPKVHISLYTRDIEAMTDFYSRVFGSASPTKDGKTMPNTTWTFRRGCCRLC
ncbi:MAG: hypothetical protein KatS3mg033_1306 [Thermonema sp.]|nr:MAG: hypothetical protein KatS3mg033_1306 [Thermonema sp.]